MQLEPGPPRARALKWCRAPASLAFGADLRTRKSPAHARAPCAPWKYAIESTVGVFPERYLTRKINDIGEAVIYGKRPRRQFREAATRYLNDFAWKRSIERDARALKALDPFIGDIWLDCVHNESFTEYINVRHTHPPEGCRRIAAGTINRDLAVARRILNLCARLWRDEGSTLTWLAEAPLIQLLENKKARKPYP